MVNCIHSILVLGLVLYVAVAHKDILCCNSLCILYKTPLKLRKFLLANCLCACNGNGAT